MKSTGRIAGLLLVLIVSVSAISAQGWRNGYGRGYGNCYYAESGNREQATCINLLPELTEEQQAQIEKMEETHQETMAGLREKRRSTFDPIEKNEIRGEMLKKVKSHRDEVRGLLNEEQQQQYDLLQARNQGRMQGFSRGRRNAPRGAALSNGNRGGRGRAAGCVRGRGGNGRGYNRW